MSKKLKLSFTKVKDVKSPQKGTNKSAGIDFFVPNDFETSMLMPGERINIPSGVHVDIPEGYALLACNKSGVAIKKGLQYTAGLIDEDYKHEIGLCLINTSYHNVIIEAGDKILQFVLVEVPEVDIEEISTLEELYTNKVSERTGGFGSTGDK